jgi:DNA-binding CsgD family transcriptional regulator
MSPSVPGVRETLDMTDIEAHRGHDGGTQTGPRSRLSRPDTSGAVGSVCVLAGRGRNRYRRGFDCSRGWASSQLFVARASRRDFDELPPKQLAALRLLAQGLERRQIAAQMGISDETVKTHLAEVRRRLGARTSAQAVAIGLVNSLFDLPAGRDDLRPS